MYGSALQEMPILKFSNTLLSETYKKLEKQNSWKLKSSKIVVSKIEVFKAKALKNWNLQTKLNNFAFESNTEIRLESTFTTWWDKAEHKARSVALKL